MTNIYQEINNCDFHDAFRRMDRLENFTYEGRNALFEYLTDLAEDTGQPIELDVIALCCEFDQWGSIEEYNAAYGTEHSTQLTIDEIVCSFERGSFITYSH